MHWYPGLQSKASILDGGASSRSSACDCLCGHGNEVPSQRADFDEPDAGIAPICAANRLSLVPSSMWMRVPGVLLLRVHRRAVAADCGCFNCMFFSFELSSLLLNFLFFSSLLFLVLGDNFFDQGFLLLLMGMYQPIIAAVVGGDGLTLAVFAAGCMVGLMGFSRLLKALLARAHRAAPVPPPPVPRRPRDGAADARALLRVAAGPECRQGADPRPARRSCDAAARRGLRAHPELLALANLACLKITDAVRGARSAA